MRITFISDTHNLHDKLNIEPCDVLIHCGDVTTNGTRKELLNFLWWFDEQPAKHKIFIAGNHDFCLDKNKAIDYVTLEDIKHAFNIIYLNSNFVDIEGVRFYGHPWTPYFGNMAFNTMNDQEDREKVSMIKPDTDILITHGPPYRIMDKTLNGEHVGSKALKEALIRNHGNYLNPKIHVFGHIHECYEAYQEYNGDLHINAANHTWLWKGEPHCPPITVEYEKGKICKIL